MEKIRYSGEFVCPMCGRHTALVHRKDGTYMHCMICGVYYDVEIANRTNADYIRSMTDEEIEEWYWWMHKEMMYYTDSMAFVHNWLKQESE